ncbi:MAG: tRNA-dihydrouridine synthase [Faecalibacterium prausnitzii]
MGYTGSQPQLRLPLRHCHRQRQGCRCALKPFSTKSSHAEGPSRSRPGGRHQPGGVRSHPHDLCDRYPICELTVHPRVMRQLYRGEADRAAFAKYLPRCRMPVCYNGDITTPAQLKALEAEFPNLSGIAGGAGGIIADPAACCGRRCGRSRPLRRKSCGATSTRLYHGYTEALRHGQLCRQPDEGPLALPHPAVRGPGSFRKSTAQGPGGLGYEGGGEPVVHSAAFMSL